MVDEQAGVDFKGNFHIWMNNPLRLSGDTLYQSGYMPGDGLFFLERTTLQIVTNGGWMTPYVCCIIVGFGMLFQFGVTLLRFLNRRRTNPCETSPFRSSRCVRPPNRGAKTNCSTRGAKERRHKAPRRWRLRRRES
jgi:hypothetical protein